MIGLEALIITARNIEYPTFKYQLELNLEYVPPNIKSKI